MSRAGISGGAQLFEKQKETAKKGSNYIKKHTDRQLLDDFSRRFRQKKRGTGTCTQSMSGYQYLDVKMWVPGTQPRSLKPRISHVRTCIMQI